VGSARLGVKVELSDLETNQKIGESIFGTASSAKEGIFGGTTSRQIDAVSDSIVTMITSAANPPLHGDTPQAFYVLSKGSRKPLEKVRSRKSRLAYDQKFGQIDRFSSWD
jgi:hypothetical protein